MENDYTNLTEREKEVLNLLMQGYKNTEIAQLMYITVHTVKAHISSIIKKLKAKNRTNVITQAVKYKIVSI